MSRISIDVSPEEHKKLKALAALEGQTIKNFLLGGILNPSVKDEHQSLLELEELLDKRITHHQTTGLKGRSSAMEIFKSVRDQS
jgi:uncharacterized protein (DUF1778 family)